MLKVAHQQDTKQTLKPRTVFTQAWSIHSGVGMEALRTSSLTLRCPCPQRLNSKVPETPQISGQSRGQSSYFTRNYRALSLWENLISKQDALVEDAMQSRQLQPNKPLTELALKGCGANVKLGKWLADG